MKRDFNLLRSLLLDLDSPREPDHVLGLHLRLLKEAGLVTLTDEGRSFAADILDDETWSRCLDRHEKAQFPLSYFSLKQIVREGMEKIGIQDVRSYFDKTPRIPPTTK